MMPTASAEGHVQLLPEEAVGARSAPHQNSGYGSCAVSHASAVKYDPFSLVNSKEGPQRPLDLLVWIEDQPALRIVDQVDWQRRVQLAGLRLVADAPLADPSRRVRFRWGFQTALPAW
jgi:hypothetical protein